MSRVENDTPTYGDGTQKSPPEKLRERDELTKVG